MASQSGARCTVSIAILATRTIKELSSIAHKTV